MKKKPWSFFLLLSVMQLLYDSIFIILSVHIAMYYLNEYRSGPIAMWLVAFIAFETSAICCIPARVLTYYVLFFMSWNVMYQLSFRVILSVPKMVALQSITWISWIIMMSNHKALGVDYETTLSVVFYAMFLVLSLVHYSFMPENVKNSFLLVYVFATLKVAMYYYFAWNFVAAFFNFTVNVMAIEAMLLWEYFSKVEQDRRQRAERIRLAEQGSAASG
jgi:hypothetical protein